MVKLVIILTKIISMGIRDMCGNFASLDEKLINKGHKRGKESRPRKQIAKKLFDAPFKYHRFQ